MSKKVTIEEIKYVFQDRGLVLLTEFYENNKQYLKSEDGDGYLYSFRLQSIYDNKSFEKVSKYNPYSLYNIQNYITKNKLTCKLIKQIYIENGKVFLRCECGEIYKCQWKRMKYGMHRYCCKCSKEKAATLRKHTCEHVVKIFQKFGYTVNSSEYINASTLINCITFDGYKGCIRLASMQNGERFEYWSKSNPYTIKNIKHYLLINNVPLELISNNYIDSNLKLQFRCQCGNLFENTFKDIRYKRHKVCTNCTPKRSSLEIKTNEYLTLKHILNSQELPVKYDNRCLIFDFKIKINNKVAFIECDGEQHYRPLKHWGGEKRFNNQQKRDQIKNKYCKENNIPLLRIPYWEFNDDLYKNKIDEFISSLE